MGNAAIQLKRVYDFPSPDDGLRILVERLWPRGLTRERAAVDFWLKEIAPSPELRKWYSHDPAKWQAFCQRYQDELDVNRAAVTQLQEILAREPKVTFVYAAKDIEHNSAALLKAYLDQS
jgi:uncharacterized protein YeaO (DUF488 family)